MSCDHGIWFPSRCLSNAEAGTVYLSLCEGDNSDLQEHPAIEAFYSELVAKHPEIDDIAEADVDNTDLCPWSIAFDHSDAHLIICCVWSKADYVSDLLRSLAEKHGLAVYDPQAEHIRYPTGGHFPAANPFEHKPWWKFW